MKIDKNSVIGICSLLVFLISGITGISGGVLKYVLFGFLFFALAVGTFALMHYVIEGKGAGRKAVYWYWCDLAPFAVILAIAQLIAGWDIYIVFYVLGILYLTVNEVFRRIDRLGQTFSDPELYKPIAVGIGSGLLYVILAFAGGSPV